MTTPLLITANGHPFRMLPVPGGSFMMGSPEEDTTEAFDDEKPQHSVTISDFYFGEFPVTQALWKAVIDGKNPSWFEGDERPVENVSWDEAQEFIKALNRLTEDSRPAGQSYRLPSEAEWEYAARGGQHAADAHKYAGSGRLEDVGWYFENAGDETKPVGLKFPNQLGLYDISGNVWEWCEDDWHADYQGARKDGRAWVDAPERGSYRVYRGGSWDNDAQGCRVAGRNDDWPDYRGNYLGFRLALSLQFTG